MSKYAEIRVCQYEVGRVSIIAPARKLRPKQYSLHVKTPNSISTYCPFCPGNEYETPPAVLIMTREGKFTEDKNNFRYKNWVVRIFPNKYPALSKEVRGEIDSFTTYGYHEVVVETPIHEEDEYLKNITHTYYALLTLKKRISEIFNDPYIKNILIIKNSGMKAGASIKHPHLQLFATTFTPFTIINELKGFKQYMEKFGKCPLCEIAMNNSSRTILNTKYFKVEARYAPRQSYELLIVPKAHKINMLEISNEELKELAWVLNNIIIALKELLGKIDYNYWIHTAPKNVRENEFHWHIEIQPLIETWGGYEKSSGVHIVTVKPEDAAKELREILTKSL